MFARIKYLLAAFDRGDIDAPRLAELLEAIVDARAQEQRPSRNQTQVGLAPVRLVGP